jgi:hypothetical protein
MPYRKVDLRAGEYYHVYNRGVARQRVFFAPDYDRYFLQRVSKYLLPIADVVAYCLMPNHYHLAFGLLGFRVALIRHAAF